MDQSLPPRVLDALIDYFATGNQETDAAAKAVLAMDFERAEYWRAAGERRKSGSDWTGIRAVEAEILVAGLRELKMMLAKRRGV